MQFRGGHAHVDRAFGDRQDIRAGVPQEIVELAGQSIVADLELLRGLSYVVDVVRRVRVQVQADPFGPFGTTRWARDRRGCF